MAIVHGTTSTEIIDKADGVTEQKDFIFGLEGKDTIYGLGGDDIMKGGGGADTFYGGSDFDEVDHGDSTEAVWVFLSQPPDISMPLLGGYRGTAEGDSYHQVENVSGSPYGDWIVGNDVPNTLRGWGGRDDMYGLGGPDVLRGGDGDDALYGGAEADFLYGDNDNDWLAGGAGGDLLSGGDGFDMADYRSSPDRVVVSLKDGLAEEGDAQYDTLTSIEGLNGSDFDDSLLGNDEHNVIWGNDGNDTLKGYGGSDALLGGNGEDTLFGGDGKDDLTGFGGADLFVWVSTHETGATPETADFINGFWAPEGDRLHLTGIDANIYVSGDQNFTFIGAAPFTLNAATPDPTDVVPGEIRYYVANGDTYMEMNTGTSGDPEGVIHLLGNHTPQPSWFVL